MVVDNIKSVSELIIKEEKKRAKFPSRERNYAVRRKGAKRYFNLLNASPIDCKLDIVKEEILLEQREERDNSIE